MIEMPRIDDDIWDEVRRHDWKYRSRILPVTLIELHATRSGIAGRTPANEYGSTLAWAKSAGNINPRPPDTWGSMESFVCGGGRVARVLADDVYPHYGLGHADAQAFAIEIGQNLNTTPFDPQDLDNAARICAFLCTVHDIPPRVLDFLSVDNHEAPGLVRHDRSANGVYLVKSDPGDLFDDREFEARVRNYLQKEEETMELIRETSSPYVFVFGPGVFYSYLHRIQDATELGVPTTIRVVADGTLDSYVRADRDWMIFL